jgi:FixJ family two-component response regulator
MSDRAERSRTGGVDGPLVCVVDDDESVRSALCRLLRSMGFRTRAFGRPDELLDGGLTERPALLLLDVQLPGMSGFELLAKTRQQGLRTPAIFISAHPDSFTDFRASEIGAAAFLAKPVDDEVLLGSIRAALGWLPRGPGGSAVPEQRDEPGRRRRPST